MKSRKIIIIALLFFTVVSFSQSKKTTTINWIRENLELYGGYEINKNFSYFQNIKVSPCKVSFTIVYNFSLEYQVSFNPSATKWSWNKSKERIIAETAVIKRTDTSGEIIFYEDFFDFKQGEYKIHERMANALNLLGTFCTEDVLDK